LGRRGVRIERHNHDRPREYTIHRKEAPIPVPEQGAKDKRSPAVGTPEQGTGQAASVAAPSQGAQEKQPPLADATRAKSVPAKTQPPARPNAGAVPVVQADDTEVQKLRQSVAEVTEENSGVAASYAEADTSDDPSLGQ